MPGATGEPSLDLGHPDVQALNAAGLSSARLVALTKGKKIDHPATQQVTVDQPQVAIPLPSVDTTGPSTSQNASQTFAQQLGAVAADTPPVPTGQNAIAATEAQQTTPAAPTDPAETADTVYQQFLASVMGGQ